MSKEEWMVSVTLFPGTIAEVVVLHFPPNEKVAADIFKSSSTHGDAIVRMCTVVEERRPS